MKKYIIPVPPPPQFEAAQNDGTPGGLINAAESYKAGSADSFDFREHDGSVGFTDATGNSVCAMKGDWIKPVLNEADQSFDGYSLVAEADATTWVEAPEAASAQ